MSKFIIQPHGRLQEWIAYEKGYFRAEDLDYEFRPASRARSIRESAGGLGLLGDRCGLGKLPSIQ